jgi:drug/metabolite transporter (DMT)-like permease
MPPDKPASSSNLKAAANERRLLVIGDILMASVALMIAHLSGVADVGGAFSQFVRRTPGWFLLLPLVWPFLMVGLHEEHRARSREQTLRGIALAAFIGFGLYLLVYFTSEPKSLPRRGVAAFITSVSVLELAWRLFYIRLFTAPNSCAGCCWLGLAKPARSS